ncbi:unnamed protein product [Parajaminaea phylloscopi]
MPPPSRNRRSAFATASSSRSSSVASTSASPAPAPLVYPAGATRHTDLSPSEARLKVARHSKCSASNGSCVCSGLKPPLEAEVVARSVHERSEDVRERECARNWKRCGVCGHDVGQHANLGPKREANGDEGGEDDDDGDHEREADDERIRRIKVAVRLDELLEEKGKLVDFQYSDEDQESLRKQLVELPNGEAARRTPSSGSPISTPPRSLRSARSTRSPSKHPVQSSKRPAEDPEEALEHAKETAEKEAEEQKAAQTLAPAGADLTLASNGASIDAFADAPPPPKREIPAVIEERTGLIQFRVVSNAKLTGTSPQDLVILTGLKNIFQRQLPKMPREYITRLVLDRNHVSMAIVKRGLQVVGGITYRPFNKRRFAEIVFCAIDSSQQVKGYGKHLMNHLKDHVKESSDVMHFLTYADNYAIGYFKKQGFTKEISLPRSVWVGYIKDYEGGTLMQCSMVPRVRYLGIHDLLAQQKELVLAKIRSISKSHIVHPGLDVFKRKREDEEDVLPSSSAPTVAADGEDYVETVKKQFKVDPAQVPGLSESGWTPEMDVLSRRPKRGPHHGLMRSILVELHNHQSSWPFLMPVNGDEVADYYDVIKQPMDLGTMEAKLENNQYKHVDDLVADAQLIFDNCRAYNPRNSPYAKCAEKLDKFLKENLPMWKQSAGIM